MENKSGCPIAVIGLACWYPGAHNPGELWENILSRKRQFRRMLDQRTPLGDYYHEDPKKPDKTYLKRAALVDGFEFDWKNRRIPFSTFQSTDIAHWLALEVSMAALEDAGFSPATTNGHNTGVIVGNTLTGEYTRASTMRLRWPFVKRSLHAACAAEGLQEDMVAKLEHSLEKYYKSNFPAVDEDTLAGGLSNTIAGRICNYLNLGGGGYTVDGACSSSLLAIATAANGLMNKDLDLALAGGVDISLDPFEIVGFAKAGALTADEMRVYDRRGTGFLPGEGCGFVVLKRLADARRDDNYIYAILHGWGISSDGQGTGITAPNPEGQARAIKRAYTRAPFNPNQLDFIEGHGTGTAVGDRVELDGISRSIDSFPASAHDPERFCGVTSLKSIIGHTKAAAGVGAFIKAVMAVNRRVLPPTAACRDPHPIFKTDAKAIYPILTGKIVSPDETLRAGVSAMGFGGINCHVCVESADSPAPKLNPSVEERALLVSHQETELFVFSGQSVKDLIARINHLSAEIPDISLAEMADLAFDLTQKLDNADGFRAAVVANDPDQLTQRLNRLLDILHTTPLDLSKPYNDAKNQIWIGQRTTAPRIGFLFPGQGAQKLNMAHRLVAQYDWARDMLAQGDRLLTEDGFKAIGPIVYRNLDQVYASNLSKRWGRDLEQTEHAQPAICMASLLWLKWLEKVGVRPTAVGGHSLGELTAFHAAGVYDADSLIRFAGFRGRVYSHQAKEDGGMIGLRCFKNEAEKLLEQVTHYAVFANINSPAQVVLAGKNEAMEQIAKLAASAGIPAFRLAVSGAFHTKLVDGAANEIKKETILPPVVEKLRCKLYSSMDGGEINPGQNLKDYFSQQVLAPVDFISLVEAMRRTCDLFIEVGPGRALTGMVNDIQGDVGLPCLPVESVPGRDRDTSQLLAALFAYGTDINWETVYGARLVRPFIPPSKRLFFENPCERPFDSAASLKPLHSTPLPESLETLFAGLGDISKEKIESYMKARGAFIARIIEADMAFSSPSTQWVPAAKTDAPDKVAAPPSLPGQDQQDQLASDETVDTVLYNTIESITGFSKDTLTPDMRLLDDLNLDSIKTGDLLARVARAIGIAGEIAPLDSANFTLGEIVQKLTLIKAKKSKPTESEKPDILQVILDQVAKLTGEAFSEINADAIVRQDLNIGKDQLKEILPRLSNLLKIDIHVDLDPLLERTLRQIASILERIYDGQQKKPSPPYESHRSPWVREFHLAMTPEEPSPLAKKSERREDDWRYATALVLSDSPEDKLAKTLGKKLSELGAQVEVSTHKAALEKNLIGQSDYSHFFNILPMQRENDALYQKKAEVREIVTRLASVAAVASAALAPRRRNTVAYLQFGGGNFGGHPQEAFLDHCGATALAATIHQERSDLRVRVLDFSPDLSADEIAKKAIAEIGTPDAFAAVGYNTERTRQVRYLRLLAPGTYKSRSFSWTKEDVILVTGGAKGITAECALGVAKVCKARVALVGRSPRPDQRQNQSETNEISITLKKYADQNLTAEYFSCDISDREAVSRLVQQVRKEMGPITGVIHGAGLNVPKETTTVSVDEAIDEVSPKLMGALNLMAALDSEPPKLFVGLTSIIGVTGMRGNAWYGFSNEALDIILHRFEANHPEMRTLSVAYSVWRDEGMGARLGSVNVLKEQGISAIPTEEGVDRFVRLFFYDPGVHQVIVAARLEGLDTWNFEPTPSIADARFLEKSLHNTPGVESAFRVHLSLEKDLYIKDHEFEGSYLFPAVFGLEAMAQAVAHVTGIHDFSRVRIENIQLTRPITIDPQAGTDILVWAEVEIQIADSKLTIARAGIYQPGIGGDTDSFSATFILGLQKKAPEYRIDLPAKPMDIDPEADLYRDTLFFQGPKFQRVKTIWNLESDGYTAKSTFTTTKMNVDKEFPSAFSGFRKMMLGDAFFRDSLLQSSALLVPQKTYLPVAIDRLDIYPDKAFMSKKDAQDIVAKVDLLKEDENEIKTAVVALNPDGTILERLEGYRLRVVSHQDEYPTVADLIDPDKRDSNLIQDRLRHLADILNVQVPHARIAFMAGLHSLPKKTRHQLELPHIIKTVREALESSSAAKEALEIYWNKFGKPVVREGKKLDIEVSLSHDDRYCLITSGKGVQGCDIAEVTSRSRSQWIELLGKKSDPLLVSLLEHQDDLDIAGTRIWCCLEAVKKINNDSAGELKIDKVIDDAIVFTSSDINDRKIILTFPIRLTRGKERMFALAASKPHSKSEKVSDDSLVDVPYKGYEDIFDIANYRLVEGGPQGQSVYIHRIPLGFKPSAQLGRKVYFSNYLFWAGEVREVSAWPVIGDIARDFSSGNWGAVTNNTYLRVLGEPTTGDQIEVRMWTSGTSGPMNSVTDLTYDFRQMIPGGGYKRVAWVEQQSTWVEILEHGVVKPASFLDYYARFMDEMYPRYSAPNVSDPLPESLQNLHNLKNEPVEYQAKTGPNVRPILHEQSIETSLCDSNIVGNIYFAFYYTWLGHTRDRYFFDVIPEYYKGTGENGELICIECRVNHLREAMPFDRIAVTMALKKLTRTHIVLYYEFFREEIDGKKTKLASGEQTNVWVKRDANGNPEASPFPKPLIKAIKRAIADMG